MLRDQGKQVQALSMGRLAFLRCCVGSDAALSQPQGLLMSSVAHRRGEDTDTDMQAQ